MEFLLSIKNEAMPFAGKWMQLEIIIVSKLNQFQKDKELMFSLFCVSSFRRAQTVRETDDIR